MTSHCLQGDAPWSCFLWSGRRKWPGNGVLIAVYPYGDLRIQPAKHLADEPGMNLGVPVLVIDDDRAMTDLVKDMLQSAGYSVAVAHNPFVGLRLVREIKPSAVLCDMVMPDMTGADVLHVLASDPTTAQIPRVMMTGHVDADRSNADGFLLKPFQANQLLDLLQRVERRAKSRTNAVEVREVFGPQTRARKLTSSLN